MTMINEPAHTLPVLGEYDVAVAGGGPAGFAAAISAAREGAKTVIIEQTGMIGGIATAGLMSHWAGSAASSVLQELYKRSTVPDIVEKFPWQGTINPEKLKFVMFEMLHEANVHVLLYTFVSGAVKEGTTLKGLIIENKSGRQAVLAKTVIDATGDGDAAARAGAEFVKGREGDGKMQPVTIMFKVAGVDYSRAVFPGGFEANLDVPKGKIQDLSRQALPFPAGHTLLYPSSLPGIVTVNMTNFIGIDGTNADDLAKAEYECRKQMDPIVKFLRDTVPGFEQCFIISTASLLGVRETRHFVGEYTLNEDDILASRVFDDWVVLRAKFNFDIHNIDGPGLDKNGAQKHFPNVDGYSIPYRSLLPKTVDGLILAGRCISGTHKAHSNYRVMPICAAMGEAAGIAASIAAKEKIAPRKVGVKKIQDVLIARGVKP
ncbi:MAG: FAD-dependent oxidoreductase [Spirochaetes bacterium]|nr:FAD-dependent oxidoreductase [Spirochaetota bacterium]